MEAFAIRTLNERRDLEKSGLVDYVDSLFARRWVDPTLRCPIFAIANRCISIPMNSIGNSAFICTIILPDPGNRLAIAIINRPGAFENLCPNQAPHVPLVILSGPIDSFGICTRVIAVRHDDLCCANNVYSAYNVSTSPVFLEPPNELMPLINMIVHAYGATLGAHRTIGAYRYIELKPGGKNPRAIIAEDFCAKKCTSFWHTLRASSAPLPQIQDDALAPIRRTQSLLGAQ